MKTLHIIPGIEQISGGPSQVVVDLCSSLNGIGVESHIATTIDPLDRYLLVDFFKVATKTFFFRRWERKNFAFSKDLESWLQTNIKKYHVVHIHSLFNHPSYVSGCLARKYKIPYIVRPAGTLSIWADKKLSLRKQIWLNSIEKRNIESAALFHATSQQEAEDIYRNTSHENIQVIPLGITSSSNIEISRRAKGETLELLFLSRLHPKKNIEALLRAVKEVLSRKKIVSLKIAGAPDPGMEDYEDKLVQLTKDLGLGSVVKFIGFVQGKEKRQAFKDAHAFILPSYNENFGVAVAEAWSYGLPSIISSQVALAPDVESSKAGIVVKHDDINDIVNAIEALIEDDDLRSQMSKNALCLAKKFSLDSTVESLKNTYKSVVDRS